MELLVAGEASAGRVAGVAVVGAFLAGEGAAIHVEGDGAADGAQEVGVAEVAWQAVYAVGLCCAQVAAFGTGKANLSLIVIVARTSHTPRNVGKKHPEVTRRARKTLP